MLTVRYVYTVAEVQAHTLHYFNFNLLRHILQKKQPTPREVQTFLALFVANLSRCYSPFFDFINMVWYVVSDTFLCNNNTTIILF